MLDIETTVKPVVGQQEGAEIGYNTLRKGRPSMAIHTDQMGVTRWCWRWTWRVRVSLFGYEGSSDVSFTRFLGATENLS